MPSGLRGLNSKIDKLDLDKLLPVPVDLNKVSHVVKNHVVKKTKCNKLIKKVTTKVTNFTITETSDLVKKADYNTEMSKTEIEINDHDRAKYITTQQFNKLTADDFAGRLKKANLASKNDIPNFVNKTDFGNRLLSFNNRINPNKTKHVLVETGLNELSKEF